MTFWLGKTLSYKDLCQYIIFNHVHLCPEQRYDYNLTIMKSPKPATDNRLKNKLKATFEIEQCWIFAVLWRPFWKWRPVEIFQCRESIQDIEI